MKNWMEFLQDVRVEALTWTLLHSLWQALLIALVITLFLVIYRNRNSSLRYWLSVLGVVLIGLCSSMTYQLVLADLQAGKNLQLAGMEEAHWVVQQPVKKSGAIQDIFPGWIQLDAIEKHIRVSLPGLTTLWFIGALIFLARMAGGYWWLRVVRTRLSDPLNWQVFSQMDHIRNALGISREVIVKESAHIAIPIVVGFLKPVILFPIGLVAHLSTADVEAILVHELAHVRRNDYLINLIISLIGVFYFFNPGYWLLCHYVRNERENCCDDLAVNYLGCSGDYVKALVRIEEHTRAYPSMALAISSGSLFNRIIRLTRRNDSASVPTNNLGLAASLVVFLLVVFSVFGFNPSLVYGHEKESREAEFLTEEIRENDFRVDTWSFPSKSQPLALTADSASHIPGPGSRLDPGPEIDAPREGINRKAVLSPALAAPGLVSPTLALADSVDLEIEEDLEYHFDFDFDFDIDIPEIVIPAMPPLPPVILNGSLGMNFESEEERQRYEEQMEQFARQMEEFKAQMDDLQLEMEGYVAKIEQSVHKEKLQEMLKRQEAYLAKIENQVVLELRDQARQLEEQAKRMELRKQESESRFNDFFDWLSTELVKDGYVESSEDHFTFQLTGGVATVNGKRVKEKDLKRYQERYEQIFDHPMRSQLIIEN